MVNIAPTSALKDLLKIAKGKYGYKITINQLRQYLYKRHIKYKDYDESKVRNMGANFPVGSEYVKPDGMTLVKVSNDKWEYKQRLIYEKYHNVKLTSDDYIIFLDQDRTNFNINNLKRVTRRESSIVANQGFYSTNKRLTKKGIRLAKKIIKLKEKEVFKMNIWEKMRKKNNLTRVEIANEMGISEEKVKEVENNMREMPKGKIDDYMGAIYKSNKERKMKIAQAKIWWKDFDLVKGIKDFGFKSQREFAKDFGCGQPTVSEWCNKKRPVGTPMLLKLYYFFNNEFNKKIDNKPRIELNIGKAIEDIDLDEWYANYDFKKALKEYGLNQGDIAKAINKPYSTASMWLNKTAYSNKGKKLLYDYFSKLETPKNENVKTPIDIMEQDYNKMLEWYVNTDLISLLKEKNLTQKELSRKLDLPSSTLNNWFRKTIITKRGVETLYNMFNVPVEQDKAIEEQPIISVDETSKIIEDTPTYTISATIDTPIEEDTTEEDLCRLKEENERLKKQLARYEMLIDMALKGNN